MEFFNDSVFIIMVIISVIITLLYLLAWFMSSKNRVGWLIFALVFFGLDTIGMFLLGGFSIDSILDILFHAWIIYYLVMGIYAHSKLKNLPIEEEETPAEGESAVAAIVTDAAEPAESEAAPADTAPASNENTEEKNDIAN